MDESRWRLATSEGVLLLRSQAIDAIGGVAHAFSTRLAFGASDFDLGPAEGDDPVVAARRRAFTAAAGFGAVELLILKQIHGATVEDAPVRAATPPEADGAIWVRNRHERPPIPAVRTADCVAVLLADRRGAAVAAVHAGWRGAAAGIAAVAVARLAGSGIDPSDLVAALGPAILGCCYEVGPEVVTALGAACGPPAGYTRPAAAGGVKVDLHAALTAQLAGAGVPAGSIHAAPYCTRCRPDLFFSFRGEGAAAGRLMAAIGPAGAP